MADTENKARRVGEIGWDDVMKILDSCYKKSCDGISGVSCGIEEFSKKYLDRYETAEIACKKMLKNQVIKCTTSGFITGFGGVLTMPVAIPANLSSVIYVQMRMIAAVAYMAGLELDGDETQTFVYACLAGVSVNQFVKQAGIKIGTKLANAMIKKIPGKALTAINQKVGFRFVTKFGTKELSTSAKRFLP